MAFIEEKKNINKTVQSQNYDVLLLFIILYLKKINANVNSTAQLTCFVVLQ